MLLFVIYRSSFIIRITSYLLTLYSTLNAYLLPFIHSVIVDPLSFFITFIFLFFFVVIFHSYFNSSCIHNPKCYLSIILIIRDLQFIFFFYSAFLSHFSFILCHLLHNVCYLEFIFNLDYHLGTIYHSSSFHCTFCLFKSFIV